jgi:hypothetical protein
MSDGNYYKNITVSSSTDAILSEASPAVYRIRKNGNNYVYEQWKDTEWGASSSFVDVTLNFDSKGNVTRVNYYNSNDEKYYDSTGKGYKISNATGKITSADKWNFIENDNCYIIKKNNKVYRIKNNGSKYTCEVWKGDTWTNKPSGFTNKLRVLKLGSVTKTFYFNSNGVGKVLTNGKWTSFGSGNGKYYVGIDNLGNVIKKNGSTYQLVKGQKVGEGIITGQNTYYFDVKKNTGDKLYLRIGKVLTNGKWTSFGSGNGKYYVGIDNLGNIIKKKGNSYTVLIKKNSKNVSWINTSNGEKQYFKVNSNKKLSINSVIKAKSGNWYYFNDNGEGKKLTKGKWTAFGSGNNAYKVGIDSLGNVIKRTGKGTKTSPYKYKVLKIKNTGNSTIENLSLKVYKSETNYIVKTTN